MSGHQQTIYTIHESQLNNGSGAGGGTSNTVGGGTGNGQRNSNSDILIDTSSIPMTQQPMPPMHHQHIQPQQQQQQQQQQQFGNDAIVSQPSNVGSASGTSRVAPEDQAIVYSVHPIFNTLDNYEELAVRQKADFTSTCCGFESVNSYTIRTKEGSQFLKAIENSNCCERCCFESNRTYNLSLVHGEEVVARINKPFRLSRFLCYSNQVRIESPEDNPIGHIRQMFTLIGHTRYAIIDYQLHLKKPSYTIESDTCYCCCTPFLCTCICTNKHFTIYTFNSEKEEVGWITRNWSPSVDVGGSGGGGGGADSSEEPFNGGGSGGGGSSNNNQQLFGVRFAENLEPRQKLLFLSACFMMDFFYFETDRRRRKLASC